MENPEPPVIRPLSQRSTTIRFFRWLFSWRGMRRLLIILAWPVTIIALVYAEENWRGRRAWNKERQKLEARGEKLDLKDFIPKAVPDEQNFAATPFIKSWFVRGAQNEQIWGDDFSRIKGNFPSDQVKGRRRFVDLVGWARAFENVRAGEGATKRSTKATPAADLAAPSRAQAAPAVLEGLKTSEPRLEELRAASQRPFSVYPVFFDLNNPWGILLPHLAKAKSACQRLQIKACAELALGQTENAGKDIELILRLSDSLKDEPFLISYLVRIACLNIGVQAIWEGLAEHRWTDAQLQAIGARLQQYDFVADVKHPLDCERAAGILTAELLYRNRYHLKGIHLSDLVNEPSDDAPSALAANFFARLAPHGWYYQEQKNYCRLFTTEGMFDSRTRRIFPEKIAAHERDFQREIGGGRLGKTLSGVLHHRLVAAMLLPALQMVPVKAANAQTSADQAALACALERYRLAKGEFPEDLQSLQSQFMAKAPTDVITGGPYHYRRDGPNYVLYSVGYNQKDDGGVPGRNLYDQERGDWVWEPLPADRE